MKPILAIDLDGALMYSRPFDMAHKRWFEVMAILLNDNSIKEYANLDNYFPKVQEVMKRYLGDIDKESRTLFARNLYAMATVAEVRQSDLVEEFATYLRKIKNKYILALITTAPEASVEPILEKVSCLNLFDITYGSPMRLQQSKKEQFQNFIKKEQRPIFYIGNGDKDIQTCRDLGISTISVNWVSQGEVKGDHDIQIVEELENILK